MDNVTANDASHNFVSIDTSLHSIFSSNKYVGITFGLESVTRTFVPISILYPSVIRHVANARCIPSTNEIRCLNFVLYFSFNHLIKGCIFVLQNLFFSSSSILLIWKSDRNMFIISRLEVGDCNQILFIFMNKPR